MNTSHATVKYYPFHRHVTENMVRRMFGEHTGVLQSLMVTPIEHPFGLKIRSITGQMPHYHRVLLDPDLDIRFHLAGYGTFLEEALIRYVGEGIERYSSIGSATLYNDMVRYGTFDDLAKRTAVIPLELLQIFSDDDRRKIGVGKYGGLQAMTSTVPIAWLPCTSIIDPSRKILTPMQVLFMGHKIDSTKELRVLPTFSTGTSAHTDLYRALLNSLLEVIQIDALMTNWYTEGPLEEVILDDPVIGSLCGSLGEFTLKIVRIPSDVSNSVYVFGAILEHSQGKRPLLVFGSQADCDPVRCAYRAAMEACAITFLGFYGPLFSPAEYFPDLRRDKFLDLDSNVGWFSDPNDAETKKSAMYSRICRRIPLSSLPSYDTGDAAHNAKTIICAGADAFKNAVFLDVTPPEVRSFGWHVVRVFAPDLVTMCLPGVPYSKHPRFEVAGGISNALPHPLP